MGITVIFSPSRIGLYAAVLRSKDNKIYFNFPTIEQAKKAISRVEHLKEPGEIKEALKKLCGDDYFCSEEASERSWSSWRSSGIHSS